MARGSEESWKALTVLSEQARHPKAEAARFVEAVHDLVPANGSVLLRSLHGRPLYHAHVVIGGDEYVVSIVPTQLNEEDAG